jgi:uncharacterized MAPEG superfamily protein
MASNYFQQLVFNPALEKSNYSYFAVPAMWIVTMLPHWYSVSLTKGEFAVSNPRAYVAQVTLKANKTETENKFLRAQAAQQNGHENLAFFAAAITAANVVSGNPASTLIGCSY